MFCNQLNVLNVNKNNRIPPTQIATLLKVFSPTVPTNGGGTPIKKSVMSFVTSQPKRPSLLSPERSQGVSALIKRSKNPEKKNLLIDFIMRYVTQTT